MKINVLTRCAYGLAVVKIFTVWRVFIQFVPAPIRSWHVSHPDDFLCNIFLAKMSQNRGLSRTLLDIDGIYKNTYILNGLI